MALSVVLLVVSAFCLILLMAGAWRLAARFSILSAAVAAKGLRDGRSGWAGRVGAAAVIFVAYLGVFLACARVTNVT